MNVWWGTFRHACVHYLHNVLRDAWEANLTLKYANIFVCAHLICNKYPHKTQIIIAQFIYYASLSYDDFSFLRLTFVFEPSWAAGSFTTLQAQKFGAKGVVVVVCMLDWSEELASSPGYVMFYGEQ